MSSASELAPAVGPSLAKLVEFWLEEDTPSLDVGGFVVGDEQVTASIMCKSPGMMAGRPFVDAVFGRLGCSVRWLADEGSQLIGKREVVAEVSGPVWALLRGERVALNVLARASGIATAASATVRLAQERGWHGEVAGTRKTTPGFRLVEKYALLVGGASTHRMSLSDMVMLKDNHVWSTGSIGACVRKARRACGFSSKVEVECRSLEEAVEAAEAGADVCMLDNFGPEELAATARQLKARFPHVLIEGSGGIRADTIAQFFSPHVDVLSLGSLTQGYAAVDFSMKVPRPSHMRARL
eukprot:CAMPEP_0196776542 /NCGR_PEP_ID=MMETSP1104-20130614/4690_1 /TAXON_ID=33652 /ORGANISM="Cafeteria sp., Strain Caron Lab Isolate" /LENGTH=296 /DNA_ID=CAMNT_0042146711 /DNA_START=28 /DNA_END=918 /DNA_ORIENTATION=+